jgi:hypothetical protein
LPASLSAQHSGDLGVERRQPPPCRTCSRSSRAATLCRSFRSRRSSLGPASPHGTAPPHGSAHRRPPTRLASPTRPVSPGDRGGDRLSHGSTNRRGRRGCRTASPTSRTGTATPHGAPAPAASPRRHRLSRTRLPGHGRSAACRVAARATAVLLRAPRSGHPPHGRARAETTDPRTAAALRRGAGVVRVRYWLPGVSVGTLGAPPMMLASRSPIGSQRASNRCARRSAWASFRPW